MPLDHLPDLPGLAYLWLQVPAVDDSAVAELSELQALVLLTRGSSPLDLSRIPRLLRADLDDRPGLVGLPESLEELTLSLSDRTDLRWLRGLRRLRRLKIEGNGQRLSLVGTPELPVLTDLYLDGVLVESGSLPVPLPDLQHVHCIADEPDDAQFDLGVFRRCGRLKTLRIRGPVHVHGVAALAALPELETVAVIAPTPPAGQLPALRYVGWRGGRGR